MLGKYTNTRAYQSNFINYCIAVSIHFHLGALLVEFLRSSLPKVRKCVKNWLYDTSNEKQSQLQVILYFKFLHIFILVNSFRWIETV